MSVKERRTYVTCTLLCDPSQLNALRPALPNYVTVEIPQRITEQGKLMH